MDERCAIFGAFTELAPLAELPALKQLLRDLSEVCRVTVTTTVCRASGGWLPAIERGLSAVADAIGEERQFILSNGEVLPIEKVKRVSKESVRHLSGHSELLGEEADGTIKPEKLYTVERLTDYATYENRFLYTLLLLIREFAEERRIEMEGAGVVCGEAILRADMTAGGRKLSYDLKLRSETPRPNADLERIEAVIRSASLLLKTPLMASVAQGDRIRHLTKTNVLRHDKNFREAVSLYEFLQEFSGTGVTVERQDIPLASAGSLSITLPAALQWSLLETYACGLEEELSEEYARGLTGPKRRAAELEEKIRALTHALAASDAAKAEAEQKLDAAEKNKRLEFEALTEETALLRAELAKTREDVAILSAQLLAARERLQEGDPADEDKIARLEADCETLTRALNRDWKGVRREMRRQFYRDLRAKTFAKGRRTDENETK